MKASAKAVQTVFPSLCLIAIILNWFGIELIEKNVELILLILFYVLALVYVLTFYFFETSIISVVFIFIMYVALFFLKTPFSWLVAIAMMPCIYIVFKKKEYKIAGVAIVFGIIVASFLGLSAIFSNTIQRIYYFSPDNKYVAVSFINDQGALGGDEDVTLYSNYSSIFIIKIKVLYYYDNSRMEWKETIHVRWTDEKTIRVEDNSYNID